MQFIWGEMEEMQTERRSFPMPCFYSVHIAFLKRTASRLHARSVYRAPWRSSVGSRNQFTEAIHLFCSFRLHVPYDDCVSTISTANQLCIRCRPNFSKSFERSVCLYVHGRFRLSAQQWQQPRPPPRGTGILGHRDAGTRDTGTSGHRGTGTSGRGDIGTPGYRDTWVMDATRHTLPPPLPQQSFDSFWS